MNKTTLALARTKRFVSNHKVAIAVTATAAVATVVHLKVVRNTNTRLTEMGIDLAEFYKTES